MRCGRVNAELPLLVLLLGLDQTERNKLYVAVGGDRRQRRAVGLVWRRLALAGNDSAIAPAGGVVVGVLGRYLTHCRRQVPILAAIARDSDRAMTWHE